MKWIAVVFVLFAASPAVADLALEIEVQGGPLAYEAPVTFVVRFVNRGPRAIRYFEPRFAGLNTFPDVTLVKVGDGRKLRPYDSPFQSMASRGLEGVIITLGPGEKKEYRYERALFMAVDRRTQKADWYEPRPLPEGEYKLVAEYRRADNLLPYNVGGFKVEQRPVEGIITGKIAAEPARFRVSPPNRPRVRISLHGRPGTRVEITFANPSDREHVFAGAARFEIGSKMYGSATASLGDGDLSVAVPAGGRVVRTVDLRALSWLRSRDASETPEGLNAVFPQGMCRLTFTVGSDGAGAGDSIWAMIPRVEQQGLEGVRVTAVLSPPDRVKTGQPVTLAVHVENLGERDVGLVHRLRFPRELVVRIEDAEGRRPAVMSTTGKATGGLAGLPTRGESVCKVARGLSWNRDRFEPAPGLTRSDFIWMEPKAGIVREIELTGLLATGLTPGRYRICAGYRNREPGVRLGFEAGRRPGTGIVWSEPVVLVVE